MSSLIGRWRLLKFTAAMRKLVEGPIELNGPPYLSKDGTDAYSVLVYTESHVVIRFDWFKHDRNYGTWVYVREDLFG